MRQELNRAGNRLSPRGWGWTSRRPTRPGLGGRGRPDGVGRGLDGGWTLRIFDPDTLVGIRWPAVGLDDYLLGGE
jgi:hypothetical protein